MLVLDCSAAMAVVLKTQDGAALSQLLMRNEKIVCPQLFIAEINSALSKYVKVGAFDLEHARLLLEQSLNLVDEFVDMRELYTEALDEGVRHGHSTYDMFYLVLARRTSSTLFTLDRQLASLCKKLKLDCILSVSLNSMALPAKN